MAKKKIMNTANNPQPQWLMGGNPAAIEAQEAEGQRELVESSELPKKDYNGNDMRAKYKELGIKVMPLADDDLFYEVELPAGWKLKAEDHTSYWSKLFDNKGKEIASIFYKAAFYDRGAHIFIK